MFGKKNKVSDPMMENSSDDSDEEEVLVNSDSSDDDYGDEAEEMWLETDDVDALEPEPLKVPACCFYVSCMMCGAFLYDLFCLIITGQGWRLVDRDAKLRVPAREPCAVENREQDSTIPAVGFEAQGVAD